MLLLVDVRIKIITDPDPRGSTLTTDSTDPDLEHWE
jgi:hypothetical protein